MDLSIVGGVNGGGAGRDERPIGLVVEGRGATDDDGIERLDEIMIGLFLLD